MGAARITGTVACEELAGGPLSVSAYAERTACAGEPVAHTRMEDGPGAFALDVPPGTWWLQATLEQDLPGAGAFSAWSHDPVTVADGDEVGGVDLVVEVPEQVR
jgi:hypothetical protein